MNRRHARTFREIRRRELAVAFLEGSIFVLAMGTIFLALWLIAP